MFAHNNLITGAYDCYQWVPDDSENSRVEIYKAGKVNGGVFMNLIRMKEDAVSVSARNWAFGDGNRVAIHAELGVGAASDESLEDIFTQYEIGETRYYVNDTLVNVFNPNLTPPNTNVDFTGADRNFLDAGLSANEPPANEATFNAVGTEFYRLFTTGEFDTELKTDTIFS
ncbi:hypothetical protein MASR2M78_21340 [Treponema sp.]